MGMFDSLWVKCPKCKREIEFQSKAGECLLWNYNISDVPGEIIASLNGESETCECGHTVTIRSKTIGFIE